MGVGNPDGISHTYPTRPAQSEQDANITRGLHAYDSGD